VRRVQLYGELSPENAMTFYKYGCALLYKAQAETDAFAGRSKGDASTAEGSKAEGSKAAAENG
jgi:HAT1-interacting factor 1